MENNNLSKSKQRVGNIMKDKTTSGNASFVKKHNGSGRILSMSATDLAQKAKNPRSKVRVRLKPKQLYDILTIDEKNQLTIYEMKINKSVTPLGVLINKAKATNLLDNAKKRYFQNDAKA